MQKYKQRKKVSKNQKLEPLVRHLLPKNTVMSTSESDSEDPEVPYDDSKSVLGNDDEIFINNPSKPEFPPTCEDE